MLIWDFAKGQRQKTAWLWLMRFGEVQNDILQVTGFPNTISIKRKWCRWTKTGRIVTLVELTYISFFDVKSEWFFIAAVTDQLIEDFLLFFNMITAAVDKFLWQIEVFSRGFESLKRNLSASGWTLETDSNFLLMRW